MSDSIPVIWLSFHENIDARGPWDTRILEALFDGSLWPHHMEFNHHVVSPGGYQAQDSGSAWSGRAIVVVPARHHINEAESINAFIGRFDAVLLILCGDEEGLFPWKDVKHPNVKFWVQMPDPRHYADMASFGYFFGNGWGAATPELINRGWPDGDSKDILWSFSGQATNSRRKHATNALKRLRGRVAGQMRLSEGFAQGAPADEYAEQLAHTWVAPCPSGPMSVDTFRVYEALEAGCIPLVDAETPRGPTNYWDFVYGDTPFPKIDNWDDAPGVVESVLANRYAVAARCSAWWQAIKSEMVYRLTTDLQQLRMVPPGPQASLQVLVTSSPVESNPSLHLIRETLASVGRQLGTPDILIACDGVRGEQAKMAHKYNLYLYHLCMWTRRLPNVLPVIAESWGHQASTTRMALEMIDAPCLLFMEHDTPLNGMEIDWDGAVEVVGGNLLDVLRFHHESHVLSEHQHLMLDNHTRNVLGLPIRRTMQWSQRPHLANTEYYRRILAEHFPPTSRTMIEDKMHGICQSRPYAYNRLGIYHPEGSIERSRHLDGRGSESKFDMRFE